MAEYQVKLKNHSGAVVALFTGTGRTTGGMEGFSFEKWLRLPGLYSLDVDAADERIELFDTDYQVEFWRRDIAGGLEWYNVFEAFHRSAEYWLADSGDETFTSRGQHYNVLLQAEPIRWAAGSDQANKSGPCETVAKAYVDENIGPGATSPPRDSAGVMPGLSIEADAATGATWSGPRANKNLLDTLIELADYAPADFMVVGTGAALFEFRWKAGQWGQDKTRGNVGGLPPVVFSPLLNNVRNVRYLHDRTSETNVCYVLGQGSGDQRRVVTRTSGAETDSPWARRAVARDARNTYSTDALSDNGDEVLDENRAKVEMQCTVKQSEAVRFGRDWDLGDLVTVEYRTFSVTQKIIGVRVTVGSDGDEVIEALMEEP